MVRFYLFFRNWPSGVSTVVLAVHAGAFFQLLCCVSGIFGWSAGGLPDIFFDGEGRRGLYVRIAIRALYVLLNLFPFQRSLLLLVLVVHVTMVFVLV